MAQCKYYFETQKAEDWMHVDNEDYLLQTRFNIMNDLSIDLLVLADGMGGLFNGKAASRKAVHQFINAFYEAILNNYGPEQKNYTLSHYCEKLKEAMTQAFISANSAVCEVSELGKQAGTTLSVVAIMGDYMVAGNVGDSPIYYYSRELEQMMLISELQTEAEDGFRKGRYLRFSEEYYQHDHILMHYMGEYTVLPADVIHYYIGEKIQAGDQVLLASDGAVGYLSPKEIYNLIESNAYRPLYKLFAAARADKDDDQTAALVKII